MVANIVVAAADSWQQRFVRRQATAIPEDAVPSILLWSQLVPFSRIGASAATRSRRARRKSPNRGAHNQPTNLNRDGARMYLGIDDNSGLIYEGMSPAPERPVLPLPMVTQAKLIEKSADWGLLSSGIKQNAQTWLFREDSFDAVTRTRRGRLFQSIVGAPYPSHSARVLPHPHAGLVGIETDGRVRASLNIYIACTQILDRPGRGRGSILALGNARSAAAWCIIDAEVTVGGDVMVMLKAQSAFGILPMLHEETVPQPARELVSQSYRKVLDSAFRESPSSVVEHCRDALQVFISRWLTSQGAPDSAKSKELAPLAADVEAKPYELVCVGNLARVVARLHGGRGKSNERIDKGARELTDEDAELAVGSVGFALRDLGWAK